MGTFFGDLPVAGTGAWVVPGTVHIPTPPTVTLSPPPHDPEETGSCRWPSLGGGACVWGGGNTGTDMKKKKPHWFTSGQSNVTFQISRLKSVASAQHFYFGSGEHLSNCFFLLFHSPFQASKPLLLFSFFIFPVLWSFLPGVSQLPGMRRIVEPNILS